MIGADVAYRPDSARRWRLWGLFVCAAIALAGAAMAVFRAESQRIEAAARHEASGRIAVGASATEHALDRAVRDLQYVARSVALRTAIEGADRAALDRLTQDWVTFSRAKAVYDQIRWLDETGMERVRVDYRPGQPVVVPDYGLQNKGKRYFFTDSIKLGVGEVFISPLDLNIEGNAVELPWKPMIRLATPVHDSKGNKRGVVILNYYGRDMLDRLRQIGAAHLRLTNAQGYWLLGPAPEDEYGFMFNRPDLTLGARSPAVWDQVARDSRGQFETEEGLWTYTEVRPLVLGAHTSQGSHEAFAPSRSRMESTAYVWKLVDFVPRAQYAEPAQMIGLRISAIASLVIALIGMALLRINRAMNAEDRAIVRLAQANAELESKVAERTRSLEDEVHVRRTAEQAARAGLDQYHSILDATSDGFWLVDERGTILDANAGYCESMGYRREEVVGHAVAEFELLQDATAIAATLARLERTSHINFESQHRAKDGTPRDLDISVSRVPGATTQVVFLRDIGARKRTEEKLKQMARIVEVADNGVMVTTPAGVITYVNAAFTAITGYTEAEAVGKTPAMLRSGRHHASFYADMWRQLQAHGHWQGYVWNRRKDGALFAEWLSVGDVRDKSGAVSHFVALFSDITRLIQSVENMEHLAHHDGLTGLPNRLLVSARLDHALERAARESKRVALMFIDLDHFKEVNDRAGHDAGDRLLQSVAARMLAVCRADDTLGRLGGDEFVVILEGVQDEADIERVGTELLAAFPMCVPTGDGSVEVTASIGLAYFPEDGHDAATLLKASDAAMYRAKQGGRNRMSRQDRCEPSERQP